MDRKPENGYKIQNSADGQAGVMVCLKLVKIVEVEDAHLDALGSNGAYLTHGTQVALYLIQS